jgi:hypothetical protein
MHMVVARSSPFPVRPYYPAPGRRALQRADGLEWRIHSDNARQEVAAACYQCPMCGEHRMIRRSRGTKYACA